jgi:hypothetical protein
MPTASVSERLAYATVALRLTLRASSAFGSGVASRDVRKIQQGEAAFAAKAGVIGEQTLGRRVKLETKWKHRWLARFGAQRKFLTRMVARGGIEPPTRGFSARG